MRLSIAVAAALLGCAAAPRPSSAQEAAAPAPTVQPGQTVRVFAPRAEIYRQRIATVQENRGDIVVLRIGGATREIPVELIQSIEVRTGHDSQGRSILIGAGVGAVAGVGMGALDKLLDNSEGGDALDTPTVIRWGTWVGLLGAAIGVVAPRDHWQSVQLGAAPVTATASASPSGGFQLSFTLRH